MKKLLSILVAAVLVTAIFTAALSVHASELYLHWVDWYEINGGIVFKTPSPQELAEDYVVKNPQTYDKDTTEAGSDAVGFLGWAMLKEGSPIATFGYMIDDEDPVYNDDFIYDRASELAGAGFPGAQGFRIVFNFTELSSGIHTATFVVKGADGDEHEMFSYAFTVTGGAEESSGEAQQPDDQTDDDAGTDAGSGAEGTADEQTQAADEQTEANEQTQDDADTNDENPATDAPATDASETEAEKPAENPKTSDAAVIAIASVVAIALAGVVIAKKINNK